MKSRRAWRPDPWAWLARCPLPLPAPRSQPRGPLGTHQIFSCPESGLQCPSVCSASSVPHCSPLPAEPELHPVWEPFPCLPAQHLFCIFNKWSAITLSQPSGVSAQRAEVRLLEGRGVYFLLEHPLVRPLPGTTEVLSTCLFLIFC